MCFAISYFCNNNFSDLFHFDEWKFIREWFIQLSFVFRVVRRFRITFTLKNPTLFRKIIARIYTKIRTMRNNFFVKVFSLKNPSGFLRLICMSILSSFFNFTARTILLGSREIIFFLPFCLEGNILDLKCNYFTLINSVVIFFVSLILFLNRLLWEFHLLKIPRKIIFSVSQTMLHK